jgi:hypothetical protein
MEWKAVLISVLVKWCRREDDDEGNGRAEIVTGYGPTRVL